MGKYVPDAITVADPFHVVGVATRALDKARRRTQNETLGHRGRKPDPLYRARKLLTKAAERLDEHGTSKLRGLLAAGDPDGHVHDAWLAKECLRDLYTLAADPDVAVAWLDGVIDDCAQARPPELRSMARTLKRWRDQILNWHITGASNGPTEALNLLIKKIKRESVTASATSTTTDSASCSTPAAATGTYSATDPARSRRAVNGPRNGDRALAEVARPPLHVLNVRVGQHRCARCRVVWCPLHGRPCWGVARPSVASRVVVGLRCATCPHSACG